MPKLDRAELERLAELSEKATQGEWSSPKPGWQPPESMGMRGQYPVEGWFPEHIKDYRLNSDALDSEEENGVAYQLDEVDSAFIAALVNFFRANYPALLELEQDARRWRFLEHGCQWVSFTPINGDTRSFDPRVVSGYAGHLQDMRAVVDAGVQRHLGILRAAIDAKLREGE